MIDLDGYSYILEQHRKAEDPPRWVYALPSADDVLGARRAARAARKEQREAEGEAVKAEATDDAPAYAAALDDLDMEVFAITITARALREVHNLARGGQALAYPADAPIGERIAWVRRLPFSWIVSLSTAIQTEGDVDDEEEVSLAATIGRPDNVEAGDLSMLDVPANGSVAAGL